ncbi:MAG: hypothetical protein ACLS9K_00515 [Lachnospira eligens]
MRIDDSSSNNINVYYQTKLSTGRWLPIVKNNEDYAGIRGQNITGLAITTDIGYIKYRVHVDSGWLDFIDSHNTDINDYYNGYAGNDTPLMLLRYIITRLMTSLNHRDTITHSR